jgi:hypothetical protein
MLEQLVGLTDVHVLLKERDPLMPLRLAYQASEMISVSQFFTAATDAGKQNS